MTEPQMTVALPQRRRHRVEWGVLLACVSVFAGCALLRTSHQGVRWEDHAEHLLGGNIHMFNNMGTLFTHLTKVCAVCFLLACALIAQTTWRHPRIGLERAVLIGSFWVLCLTSGIAAKRALSHLIGPDAGTLPSGHTTAALAACGAVMCAAAGRWREVVVPAMAFMSSLYIVSVVNAYIHRPGDALAAVALCAGWAIGIDLATDGARLPRASHELSNRVLVTIGSATALITTLGWGSGLQVGLGNHLGGWAERLILTCAGGLYALYLARIADRLGGRVRTARVGTWG